MIDGQAFKPDWRVHPGEILKDIIEELRLSQKAAAVTLGISPQYLNDVLLGRRAISRQLAVRLGGVFGPTPGFWMRLQALYEEPP